MVLDDRRVSRRHAKLVAAGAGWAVEDLGSPNGTFVNDQRVRSRVLEDGDELVFGKARFRFELGRPPAEAFSDTVLRPEGAASVSSADIATGSGPPTPPPFVKPVRDNLVPDLTELGLDDYFEAAGIHDDAFAQRQGRAIATARNYAVLYAVSRTLQQERDVRAMLEAVLGLLLKVLQAEQGFVALIGEDGAAAIEVAVGGDGAAPVLSQTVSDHVLSQSAGVICLDSRSDARFVGSESLMLHNIRALMAAPILLGRRVLGLVQLESREGGRRYTEPDLDLLTVVTSMLGVSLENLRLARRREETIAALEAAQAQLLAAQARVVEAERTAVIGRFATGIAHEVKNHLSPFMLADMIARRYPEDEDTREAAEMMLEARQHILDLVNEIRACIQGDPSRHQPEPVDVEGLLAGALRFARCDRTVAEVATELSVREPVQVWADPRGLRQVLINLIKNAAEAAPKPGGRVELRAAVADGRVCIDVADNGTGIAPEDRARVFEPFFSTKGVRGLGLGLDVARRIAEQHGGRLDIVDVPAGTCFRLVLPPWDPAFSEEAT